MRRQRVAFAEREAKSGDAAEPIEATAEPDILVAAPDGVAWAQFNDLATHFCARFAHHVRVDAPHPGVRVTLPAGRVTAERMWSGERVTLDRHATRARVTFRVTSIRTMGRRRGSVLGLNDGGPVAERDRRRPGGRTRPNTSPRDLTRPREGPRPSRSTRSDDATVTLLAPTFVTLSADKERQAVEALAELLVPLLTESPRLSAGLDAPSDVTRPSGERWPGWLTAPKRRATMSDHSPAQRPRLGDGFQEWPTATPTRSVILIVYLALTISSADRPSCSHDQLCRSSILLPRSAMQIVHLAPAIMNPHGECEWGTGHRLDSEASGC